ncbi:MAG TPA: hypothetical protein PL045_13390 [Chitinophagaceae bacterium]|nr:hypothetical protein [Chitinophagaceae bacterium]
MKIFLKAIIFTALVATVQTAGAQVVMKEFLSQNHEGVIAKSVSNGGKPLYYKFEYKSTEGLRINYTLYLYKDAAKTQPFLTLPVLMRDLVWTYYLDITFTKDNMSKVAALIFKKDLRWSRVKYSPHEGCSNVNPITWERLNMVNNFESLLNNTIMQLDKNVNFNCYAAK